MLRDPAIMYIKPDGTTQQRDPFWKSVHPTQQEAVSLFFVDTNIAQIRIIHPGDNLSDGLSECIPKGRHSRCCNTERCYADIISICRFSIVDGSAGDGWHRNNDWAERPRRCEDVHERHQRFFPSVSRSIICILLADRSISTHYSRVTPVEVLYASFPAFLYVNASYGGYLLEPILEYSNSTLWTFPYAPKDLGTYVSPTALTVFIWASQVPPIRTRLVTICHTLKKSSVSVTVI